MLQSTPPHKGATKVFSVPHVRGTASIHAPSQGGDKKEEALILLISMLQSTPPHKGATLRIETLLSFRTLQSTPPHKGATAILPNSPHPFFNKFDKSIRKIALTFHFPAHSRPYHTIFVQFFKCESPSTFMCASHSHRFSTILNFPIFPLLIQKSKGSVTSNPGLAPMCSTLFLYLSPK